MFTSEALRDLFRHMEWADAVIWRAVDASRAAKDDAVVQGKLRHLHRTQQFFLEVWRGETIKFEKIEIPFADELPLAQRFHSDARDLLATATEMDLAGELTLPWADRFAKNLGRDRAETTTRGETMYQLAAHSTYHRGQVNMRLRELGETPPLTDYIAWLWVGRPEAEWPAG